MIRRYLLFIILAIINFSTYAMAKTKVIESSNPKKPAWVDGVALGYIITTATAESLEDARTIVLEQVRDQIISSVATHVVSESQQRTISAQNDNQVSVQRINVKTIKSMAGDIPFLNDVSLSHAEDYYWEKIKIGKDAYLCNYSVKYPFSDNQLQQLIFDFSQREQMLNRRMDEFNQTFSTWEELMKAESQLLLFQSTLQMADEKRFRQCSALLKEYHQRYPILLGNYLEREYNQMPADGCRLYETSLDTIFVSIVTLNTSLYSDSYQMDRVATLKANRQAAETLKGAKLQSTTFVSDGSTSPVYSEEIVSILNTRVNFGKLLKKFLYNKERSVYIYVY